VTPVRPIGTTLARLLMRQPGSSRALTQRRHRGLCVRSNGSAQLDDYTDCTLMFTGTLIATVPLLLVFILFGRQLISGIMDGAVRS